MIQIKNLPKFQKALDVVSLGTQTKSTNKYYSSVWGQTVPKESKLILRSFNSVSDVVVTIGEVESDEELKFCVDEFFIRTIKTFFGDEVTLTLTSNDIQISQDKPKRKHSIAILDADGFNEEVKIPKLEYKEVNASELVKVLKVAAISSSNSNTNKMARSYDVNPHINRVLTTNGDQVIRFKDLGSLNGNIANPPVEILSKFLSLISQVGEKDKLEIFFGTWSAFKISLFDEKAEDFWFVCEIKISSIASGKFPDRPEKVLNSLVETEPTLTATIQKSKLQRILDICLIYFDKAFTNSLPHHTRISRKNGNLAFEMSVKNLSTMDEELLECETIEGSEEYEMLFHIKDLSDAIGVMGENLKFKFYGALNPFIIEDLDDPQMIYLQVHMKKD